MTRRLPRAWLSPACWLGPCITNIGSGACLHAQLLSGDCLAAMFSLSRTVKGCKAHWQRICCGCSLLATLKPVT